MRRTFRQWIGTAFATITSLCVSAALAAAPTPPVSIPPATLELAQRVLDAGDHRGAPFAIVDKRAATLVVFRADGRLAGASPALLGAAAGDHALPGAGERAQSGRLRPQDRTTPAGRFPSEPGRNHTGEPIVWLDYEAALAIHRMRPAPAAQRRPARLASPNPDDNRISAGCVIVPEAFYLSVVEPLLGRARGVVYVMPEERGWQAQWPALAAEAL